MTRNIHHLHRVGSVSQLDLYFFIVQYAVTQFFAKHFAGLFARIRAAKRINYAVFRAFMGIGFHDLAHFCPYHDDGTINQIAHDLFYVTANIANFSELGGFNFDKGRVCQFCQTPRNFSFTHTCWADHQDVFWINLIPDIIGQLLAPPTVTQCHSNRAFGVTLADNETVKFGYNFTGG